MCVVKVNSQLLKELAVKKRTEVSNTFFPVLLIITEIFFKKVLNVNAGDFKIRRQ